MRNLDRKLEFLQAEHPMLDRQRMAMNIVLMNLCS